MNILVKIFQQKLAAGICFVFGVAFAFASLSLLVHDYRVMGGQTDPWVLLRAVGGFGGLLFIASCMLQTGVNMWRGPQDGAAQKKGRKNA